MKSFRKKNVEKLSPLHKEMVFLAMNDYML